MATNTAPLLSIAASGQIAKTQVYSSWRGIPYTRKYVVPANPKSSGQELTRNTFTYLSNVWKYAGAILQAPWTAYSTGQPFYNRNAWIGRNVKVLRTLTENTDMVFSPGANGGIGLTSVTGTASAGSMTVTPTWGSTPAGWTQGNTQGVAILQDDPQTGTDYVSIEGASAAAAGNVTLAGSTGKTYVVSAWPIYTKSDGTTAYGPSTNYTQTT